MYRHQLLVVVLVLLGIATGPALAAGNVCPAETIAATDFSLQRLDDALADTFGSDVRVISLGITTVHQGDDMQITHRLDIATAPLLQGVRDAAARSAADASSESHVLTVGQPHAVVSNGMLIVSIPLTYTLKVWAKFDWICCRRLKCRKCYKRVWTKVVQKTVDLQVAIEGRWNPVLDLRAVEMPINLRAGRTEERLIHGISKLLPVLKTRLHDSSTQLRDNVGALRLSQIRKHLPQLRGLSPRAKAERTLVRFERNLKPVWFGFRKSASHGPTLSLVQTGSVFDGLFCEAVRPRLRETFAYLDSFRRSPVCEAIPRGGSLYRLADKHYGSGECFVALEQINSIRGVDVANLRTGDLILVPPLHLVLASQRRARSVRRGDNRWSIARDSGDASGTSATGDLKDGQDPDLIFPCQYVWPLNDDALKRFVEAQDVCPN